MRKVNCDGKEKVEKGILFHLYVKFVIQSGPVSTLIKTLLIISGENRHFFWVTTTCCLHIEVDSEYNDQSLEPTSWKDRMGFWKLLSDLHTQAMACK